MGIASTSKLRSTWPRLVSGAAILAVAVVAGLISYSHIYELSLTLHQSVMVARLMPVGIDGLITVGSVVLLQGGRLGWLGIGPGVAISLFANVESGIRYGVLAAIWAGIPAVSFALASFILESWLKEQAKPSADAEGAPAPAPESTPTVTSGSAPEPIARDAQGSAPESVPKPVLRSVKRAPRQPRVATPESTYAALLAAGQLPSIRAIRRDLRVGDARAKAIRGQLEAALKAA